MSVRKSKRGKIRILKKRPDGYQFAKQPSWGQLQSIKIVAGEKDNFPFGDCIKNAIQGAIYCVETSSNPDNPDETQIKDPQLSEVVQIRDKTQPIVHVDASSITVANSVIHIYFRLIHISPNKHSGPYRSMWTHLTIVSQGKADKWKSKNWTGA